MEGRPKKAENLKIIEHMGTYYGTFDGSKMWKLDNWLYRLLRLCDGKKSFSQIVDEITQISGFKRDDIDKGLEPVLKNLEKDGLIVVEK